MESPSAQIQSLFIPKLLKKHRYGSRGFSLIELLVVIAIIVILVALLMPTLGRIRETAKMTKCMSNLRQISIATFSYAADYGGFVPWDEKTVNAHNQHFVARSHDSSHISYRNWYPKNKWFAEYFTASGELLGKMNPIGYCPKGGVLGDGGAGLNSGEHFNFSYGTNPDLHEDWWITNGNANRCSVPLSQIKNPGKVCLWMESNESKVYHKGDAVSGRHFSTNKVPANEPGPVVGGFPVYQFHGKCNIVYVDQRIGTIMIPDQTPVWSCSFWDHSKKQQCNPGVCGYCDNDLK